jgi:hypothetical protein
MQKWEYLSDKIRSHVGGMLAPTEEINNRLNELGQQGWELVDMMENRANNELTNYLKRPTN